MLYIYMQNKVTVFLFFFGHQCQPIIHKYENQSQSIVSFPALSNFYLLLKYFLFLHDWLSKTAKLCSVAIRHFMPLKV